MGTLRENKYTVLNITRSGLLRMTNDSHIRDTENKNTHFILLFFRKSCRLWDMVEKYRTAGQATDDNMAHAHCILDT
jgi:hypothetical protein